MRSAASSGTTPESDSPSLPKTARRSSTGSSRGAIWRPGYAGIGFAKTSLLGGEPVVDGTVPGSPAAKAGIDKGDRIIECDGRPVTKAYQIKESVCRRYAGDAVRLTIDRAGVRLEKTLTLAPVPKPSRETRSERLTTTFPKKGLAMNGIEDLTPAGLAAKIDHTFLKAFGPPADVERLCEEAKTYGFAAAVVNPAEVERAVTLLEGTGVAVCTVVAFPLGQATMVAKQAEAIDAINRGATELDMVVNIRDVYAGHWDAVSNDVAAFAEVCRRSDCVSKLIFETCYLDDDQKRELCRVATKARVDFVKTSTGFGTDGATVEDVRLMARESGPNVQVKAAGGIRTLAKARAMLEAGATRIGTSNGPAIVDELARSGG